MNHYDPRRRYDTAMQKLSELVLRRNGLLQKLDEMCVQASRASAEQRVVTAFDVERARRILKRIGRQNSRIARAMSTVNKYAAILGESPVRNRKPYPPRNANRVSFDALRLGVR